MSSPISWVEGNLTGIVVSVNRVWYKRQMRRAARVDDNQNEIVAALRKAGATVRVITQGDGLPDLLVGYRGETILMEVKDGSKSPSARKLTDREEQFFREWTGGRAVVVNSVAEAVRQLGPAGGGKVTPAAGGGPSPSSLLLASEPADSRERPALDKREFG